MSRKEPTVSVRIRQSDYDILLSLMAQEHAKSITDTITFAVAIAASASK